jgi:enoyl-CoA hydratase
MMDLKNILFKKENQMAFITLNRPDVYNALNHPLFMEMGEVIEEVKMDREIGALIITGAGEKAFASGADINEVITLDIVSGWENSRDHQIVLNRLEQLGKPSIAAVNGYCLGGGLELAMACSIRVASERARFGLPEVSLGLTPAFGGTQRLTRLVGRGKAIEMILTGKPIDAQEAFRIGLVNQVVVAESLIPKAREMAESILKNSPTAVRVAMELILRGMDMSLDNSIAFESAMGQISLGSPEAVQRLKVFLEKKK